MITLTCFLSAFVGGIVGAFSLFGVLLAIHYGRTR